ncbi:hypothetical protein [Pedobacter changchengzhani]|uniref:hypothetical protein n=1 Tax=Pedobacter changchengzhani TaxID=2529274 RepID=UPI001A9F4BAC|nr:hypothetical protein [Pedobacter changchengzhani]
MAVLHRKEEKIQAVLGRLSKKYTQEQFVEMFIKLYSKDWGKIKSAYIKQSQDKLPGAIINMPKPEIYLKQVLSNYLQQVQEIKPEPKPELIPVEVVEVKKPKTTAKKATDAPAEAVKTKKVTAKKTEKTDDVVAEPKKVKAPAKKKVEATDATVDKPVKAKAVPKKKEEAIEDKPKTVRKTAVKK